MKKLLLSICALLLVGAASCGNTSSSETPSSSEQPSSSEIQSSESEPASEDKGSSSEDSGSSSEDSGASSEDSGTSSEDSGTSSEDSGTSSEDSGNQGGEDSGDQGGDETPENYTIYYYNSLGWETICAHSWVTGGAGTKWPGTPLTAVEGEEDWYSISFTAEEMVGLNIIFNNGGNGKQTADIALDTSKLYFYGMSDVAFATKDEAIEASTATPETVYYLKGTVNGWTGSSQYLLKADLDDPTQYIATFELPEGAEFKLDDTIAWEGADYGYDAVEKDCQSLVSNSGGNIKIKAAGTYNIYFKTATSTIWIALAE